MNIIYGLKNCDGCRKSMRWLASRNIEADLLDVRDSAVPDAILGKAAASFGIDSLINRRSTTWRQLDDAQKEINSVPAALALIDEYPALMKRPLLVVDGEPMAIGFNDKSEAWLALK